MALRLHVQFPWSLLGVFDVKAALPRHARILGPVQGPKGRSLAVPKMNLFVRGEDDGRCAGRKERIQDPPETRYVSFKI